MQEHGGLIAVRKAQCHIRRNNKLMKFLRTCINVNFNLSYLNSFIEISSVFST